MICGEKAFLLASEDGKRPMKTEVDSLNSTQEETDSTVILYCFCAKEQSYRYVRVKSPDFICLHYAKMLDGIQKQLINITELADQEYTGTLYSINGSSCIHML